MAANSKWRRRAVYCLAVLLVLVIVYFLVRPPATTVTHQPVPGRPDRMILSVTFPLWPGGDSNIYDANLKGFHVSARFPVEVRKGTCTNLHILEQDMDCPAGNDPLQIRDERTAMIGRWNRVVVSYELQR